MNSLPAEWELDYYSRPLLDPKGKKRWELLLSSSNNNFRFERFCSAESVNSQWLKQAISDALAEARAKNIQIAPRLRCWRNSMRTMVQRAAEALDLEVIPSRRCYALQQWLQEREASVYPAMEGYQVGPLAPPATPIRPIALPLPDAVRGEQWWWRPRWRRRRARTEGSLTRPTVRSTPRSPRLLPRSPLTAPLPPFPSRRL